MQHDEMLMQVTVSMIKRGSKKTHSTPDDVAWLQHFRGAVARGHEETRANGTDTLIGFMPGLWRTVNDKSAFAHTVAAASAPASCGSNGNSSHPSPSDYHPETYTTSQIAACHFINAARSAVRCRLLCSWSRSCDVTVVQVLAASAAGASFGGSGS